MSKNSYVYFFLVDMSYNSPAATGKRRLAFGPDMFAIFVKGLPGFIEYQEYQLKSALRTDETVALIKVPEINRRNNVIELLRNF